MNPYANAIPVIEDCVASDVVVTGIIEPYASIIIVADVVACDAVPAGKIKDYAIAVHADGVARDGVAAGIIKVYATTVVRADDIACDGVAAGILEGYAYATPVVTNVVACDIVIVVIGTITMESYARVFIRADGIACDIVDIGIIEAYATPVV